MKLFHFLKLMSSTVHEECREQKHKTDQGGPCTSLTVWRKSLLMSCNGFTVIDSNGNLVYRVDNYGGRPEEVTLMDGSGTPLLTVRRRKVNNINSLLSLCPPGIYILTQICLPRDHRHHRGRWWSDPITVTCSDGYS